MEMKRLAACISIFCLMFSSVALAQWSTSTDVLSWVEGLGSVSLILWLVGGLIIFLAFLIFRPLGHLQLFKYSVYIGLIIIFFATFAVQIVYITPYLGRPVVTYTICGEVFPTTQNPINDFVVAIACIFSGYAPSNLTVLTLTGVTFFIFGIIAPLGVLMALFYDFTDFIENTNVRRIMTFLSSLIAFRFLLASMFTELLGYGFAGLGILIIDYFFFMILFKMVKKLWAGYEAVEDILAVQDRELLSSLLKERDTLQALIKAGKNGGVEKRLNYVNKQIEKLAKRLKLPRS